MKTNRLIMIVMLLVISLTTKSIAQTTYKTVTIYNRFAYVPQSSPLKTFEGGKTNFKSADYTIMDYSDLYAINSVFKSVLSEGLLNQLVKNHKSVALRFGVDNTGQVVSTDFYFNKDPKIPVQVISLLADLLKKSIRFSFSEKYTRDNLLLTTSQNVYFSKVVNGEPIHDKDL